MNKKTTLLALLLTATAAAWAQKIEIKNNVVDCGQVSYRSPVTAEFALTNKSNDLIVISDARTSCGCTTVDYPKDGLQGGATTMIRATYDAKQLGHFRKQVALYSKSLKTPIYLTMKGVVVEEVVDYSGDYPYQLGLLKTDINNIEFDDVNDGDRLHKKIHVFNTSSDVATPVVMHLPSYLTADVSPSSIAPGRSGVVTLTLDSKALKDYGLTQTSVYLGQFPGDKVSTEKEIAVSAVLLPDFQELTEEERLHAPQLNLSTKTLDLGPFNGKSKIKGDIMIMNVGESQLEIRSLQMFTSGLQVSLNKTRLQPGEVGRIRVTAIEKSLRNVRSQPRLLMITNDPTQPKVVIDIVTR